MNHSTTDTYILKREILSFSNKISKGLPIPSRKFAADIIYGILASSSCLLTDISDALHEKIKKVNTVDRLSKHLSLGIPKRMLSNYINIVKHLSPSAPVIHIDDSDVIKPEGYHFEALGYVRDGSKSSKDKHVLNKGYHVTEACVLTSSGHPASIFSKIHSSRERHFTSINDITFSAIDRAVGLFGKVTFAMDRGYDDNKIFRKLFDEAQDFVIRLTAKRKVSYHGKWIPVTQLCAMRKGKLKVPLIYRGVEHDAYLSHIRVQITAAKRYINLILVYGITEHPMMLATNKDIRSKDDLIGVAGIYFSRWRIEEYFRAKKQIFGFEGFRVRKLEAMNALNLFLSAAMTFLAQISEKPETSSLKVSVIKHASPIREKVAFQYYRLARGIYAILAYAREGVRLYFRTKRPRYRQLCLRLIC